MALILPIGGAKQILCSDITQGGRLNARTIKRNSGGRRCVEVRWRMYFHDSDFYSRVLVIRICELLRGCFSAALCVSLRFSAFNDGLNAEIAEIRRGPQRLPTDYKFFGLLPNREIRPDRTTIQFVGLIQ